MKQKSAVEEVEKMLSNVGLGDQIVIDKGASVEWLDLPKELLIEIAKHLDTTIDILRLRGVCKIWRSVLPHPFDETLQISIPLCNSKYFLLQVKICRLEPLSHQDPSNSPSKGWIVRFGESKFRPLHRFKAVTDTSALKFFLVTPELTNLLRQLLVPIRKQPLMSWLRNDVINDIAPRVPRVLNLMDFKVVELIEAYTLNLKLYDKSLMAVPGVHKVVLVPSFPVEDRMVFALYDDGKMGFCKIREGSWNIMNDGNTRYDDIMHHKGHLYLVDKRNIVFQLDVSSLKLVQFSTELFFGSEQVLVESGGSLHVVDLTNWDLAFRFRFPESTVVYIKVYKFDEETKDGGWLHVEDLGDVFFVLTKEHNFSLSAQDYYGLQRNCIYFYGKTRLCCYSLKKGRLCLC